VPSWVPLGDRAIRFARPAEVSPRTIVKEVRAWPGVVDVVVARDDVAAYFAAEPVVADIAIRALAKIKDDLDTVRELELAATYDGPDLDDVASSTGTRRGTRFGTLTRAKRGSTLPVSERVMPCSGSGSTVSARFRLRLEM
jgi:hypothetical protein